MPHSFITGSVYHVLFRAMAAEQDNLDKCRYLFFRSIALVAVYATPFYIGLLWLAEPFIRGVYGEKWVAAAGPLMILAFAWPFWLMDNLSGAVLAAQNWLDRELPVQIATLVHHRPRRHHRAALRHRRCGLGHRRGCGLFSAFISTGWPRAACGQSCLNFSTPLHPLQCSTACSRWCYSAPTPRCPHQSRKMISRTWH